MIIDDDFLTDEESLQFYNDFMVKSPELGLTWYLGYRTSEVDVENYATEDAKTHESFQMVAPCMPGSPMYYTALNLFNKFRDKHGITYKEIHRVKFNLLPMIPEYEDGLYHTPHVDTNLKHNVFLYYVNDADGDTFFFNEMYNGYEVYDFSLQQRVSPKRGRAVTFDGHQYHASSSPTKSTHRIILNIDYM